MSGKKQKADSTINRHLRELRALIESPDTDSLTKRVAWEVEHAIRWARRPTVGWPSPVNSVLGTVHLIRQESPS